MLGIFLYCLGVMYTPGPVNILSLNSGVQRGSGAHVPFCIGVGFALFFWFMLIGYTGSAIITESVMPVIASLGVAFIIYLAWKIATSEVGTSQEGKQTGSLSFRDGLFMQLFNPKSFLAVLPVTAVQFPAAGIDGGSITAWSAALGTLGFGAPFAYAVAGAKVSRFIEDARYLRWFNQFMAVALVLVAVDMGYHHIYLGLQ